MSSERQEYNEISPWWGEHIHRYLTVINSFTNNPTVLDLACGNGFGTYLISKATEMEVIGGDISFETIQECKQRFKNSNLNYQQMNGTSIPYGNKHFDIITSFETIEHTTAYINIIAEFERVLSDKGTLIISTPNIIVNSPSGIVENQFHTQEFTYDELFSLLNNKFEDVKIYGQQYIRYQAPSILNYFGKHLESFFYLKGIRKLPLFFQNRMMKMIIGKNIYPMADDFLMTTEKNTILKCKTFYAICKKNRTPL